MGNGKSIIHPREYTKTWSQLRVYQKTVIDRIDKSGSSFYADHELVNSFITPNFPYLARFNSGLTMCLGLPGLAQRVYDLHSKPGGQCDDYLDVIFDSLVQSGFITGYRYVGGFQDSDEKELEPECRKGLTFKELFLKNMSVLTEAKKIFSPLQLAYRVRDVHFIDTRMFILGVGKWEVSISPQSYCIKIQVGEYFEIRQDYLTGKYYFRNLKTGIETDVSRKKKWAMELILLLSGFYKKGIISMQLEDITMLWGKEDNFLQKTVRKKLDIESNQLKTLESLLNGIDADDVYSFRDSILTFHVPIVLKEYGSG